MSLLFADIYDSIRTIRITKGVSEKDILNFVQDKVGGCMKVGNVLKTIRTLKKLCEDGVLRKKGKRYMFAPKECRKPDKCEEDDDDEGDDECEDDIQPQVADSCDECDDGGDDGGDDDEEEEDDDDDDDDDDEEDDDDDDEDEDECDDKDAQTGSQEPTGKKDNPMEMNRNPIKSKESFLGAPKSASPVSGSGGNGENGNGSGTANCLDKKVNRAMAGDMKKTGSDRGRKTGKGKSMADQERGDATSKGNEAIAFCVRDFIDSLGRPDSEALEFGKELSLKKRAFRNKRNAGRSRSPMKEPTAELYHCLGKGTSDEIGFRAICSDLFQEPTDVDMDVDPEKEDELNPLHRNLPSGVAEPGCDDAEKKMRESVKMEHSYDDFSENLAKKNSVMVVSNECQMQQMTWFPLEEREKESESLKRTASSEDDERTGGDEEKTVSLCSVCEKKKRRNP